KGRVISVRSSKGDWRLRAAAVAAARKATFSPEKLADQAQRGRVVSGTITYNFLAPTESPATTVSQEPTQTNSESATGSSTTGAPSATGSSASNVVRNYPLVGGALVGAERDVPQPDYPKRARSRGKASIVTVVVRVNRRGKVISSRTLERDPDLRAAALRAARKATFHPDKLTGKGNVVGTITYNLKP
ncbi:MAG: TonB family protein, partial [Pyrinomonadaceae bacterium]